MVNHLETVRRQIEDKLKAAQTRATAKSLREIDAQLASIEFKLLEKSSTLSDDKYFVQAYKVYSNLIWLNGAVGTGAGDEAGGADYRPTDTQVAVLRDRSRRISPSARAEYQAHASRPDCPKSDPTSLPDSRSSLNHMKHRDFFEPIYPVSGHPPDRVRLRARAGGAAGGGVQRLRVPEPRAEPDDRTHLRTSRSIRRIPSVWYVASASGNLWKTENRGNTLTRDVRQLRLVLARRRRRSIRRTRTSSGWARARTPTSAASASATASTSRPTPGKTWKRMGLENSEHIQNIIVDPRNSNTSTSRRLGRCGRRAAIAASTRRPTAGRPGRRC